MIKAVRDNLNSTFDDIKKIRYKHLLKILNNIDDDQKNSNLCTYGVNNYYYAYETMIDNLFGGIQDQKKIYNPNGYWTLINHQRTKASDLRPDTILIKDKNGFSLLQIDPSHHSLLVRKHLSSFDQKSCQNSLGSMQACSEEELALPINYAIDLKIEELDFFQWQRIPLFWNPNLNQESVLTNMSASSMKDLFLLPLDTYSNITR